MESVLKTEPHYLLNTYARPPLLFTHGKGCAVYTDEGREYLDMSAGIAVTALGHADDGVGSVMAEQAAKISHASNLYWNEWAGTLAKQIVEGTRRHGGLGLDSASSSTEGGQGTGAKVFFSNSGTEANEGALKFARMYGKTLPSSSSSSSSSSPSSASSSSRTTIVCFSNAFHGRTMGALSVTPNPKYQAPFTPLIPNVRVGKYNDMNEEALRTLVDESVCGVIVEPIQGEGGVGTGQVEWMEMLGRRCKEVGALLIFDEIQVSLVRVTLILLEEYG
jgi:acetylornithine aminotransferase